MKLKEREINRVDAAFYEYSRMVAAQGFTLTTPVDAK